MKPGGVSGKSGKKKRRETGRNRNYITKMFSIKVKINRIFSMIYINDRYANCLFMLTMFFLREQN